MNPGAKGSTRMTPLIRYVFKREIFKDRKQMLLLPGFGGSNGD